MLFPIGSQNPPRIMVIMPTYFLTFPGGFWRYSRKNQCPPPSVISLFLGYLFEKMPGKAYFSKELKDVGEVRFPQRLLRNDKKRFTGARRGNDLPTVARPPRKLFTTFFLVFLDIFGHREKLVLLS